MFHRILLSITLFIYVGMMVFCSGPIFVEADRVADEELVDCRSHSANPNMCIRWYPYGTAIIKVIAWPMWTSYRIAKQSEARPH